MKTKFVCIDNKNIEVIKEYSDYEITTGDLIERIKPI